MSSTKDYTPRPDPLRPIRFVIYLTTVVYGFINLIYGPGDPPAGTTPFATIEAATLVGIFQFFLALVAVVLDLTTSPRRGIIKFILLMLSVSYIYEGILAITSTKDPFSWAPLFVYAAICSVLYLAKD
jgi:hypothetical protein